MKKFLEYALMLISLLFVNMAFQGCSKDNNEPQSNDPQEGIIGKWVCYDNAYGDPWDEPLIFQFDSDGSGYLWFQDESFSDRWEFFYTVTESRLRIKSNNGSYNLRYELSNNRKNLIIYDLDDDDMEELHFVKQK